MDYLFFLLNSHDSLIRHVVNFTVLQVPMRCKPFHDNVSNETKTTSTSKSYSNNIVI